jgi:hypothetical protein
MNKNGIISISFVIAIAFILTASSPSLMNVAVYAQSGDDEEDNTSGSGEYEEFVNCLAQSEGDKGFASEDEIRDCFRPIYDPEANANSVASADGDDDGSSGSSDSGDDDATSNTDEESSN